MTDAIPYIVLQEVALINKIGDWICIIPEISR